jgi:hypothetical protein
LAPTQRAKPAPQVWDPLLTQLRALRTSAKEEEHHAV